MCIDILARLGTVAAWLPLLLPARESWPGFEPLQLRLKELPLVLQDEGFRLQRADVRCKCLAGVTCCCGMLQHA